MSKIESLKNSKFSENLINDSSELTGGGNGIPILWRLTKNMSVSDYSNCGDDDPSTYSCDTAQDNHVIADHDHC